MADLSTTDPLIVELRGLADALAWPQEHPGWPGELLRRGAIIFKGAGIRSPRDFDAAVGAYVMPTLNFAEETSPRTAVTDLAYTSTEYPAEYPIQFHNEFSYRSTMPECLLFACLQAPASRGATPIADGRKVLALLPADLVERFTPGVQYDRGFVGLGVPWQKVFGTESLDDVRRYCAQSGVQLVSSPDGFHTRQHGNAIVTHPVTGERVWCNHVLNFNVHGIQPEDVRDMLVRSAPQWRPTNSLYHDGGEIEPGTVAVIRDAYEAVAFRHPWNAGDFMIIDNILTAHGRDPFTGPRRLVVSMGARSGTVRSTLSSLSELHR